DRAAGVLRAGLVRIAHRALHRADQPLAVVRDRQPLHATVGTPCGIDRWQPAATSAAAEGIYPFQFAAIRCKMYDMTTILVTYPDCSVRQGNQRLAANPVRISAERLPVQVRGNLTG